MILRTSRIFLLTSITTVGVIYSLRPQTLNRMGQSQSNLDSVLAADGLLTTSDAGSSPALLLRKLEIFGVATLLFSDYKILQWRCDQIDDTAEGEALKNRLWDEAHVRNAKYLYEKFSGLEALWIKLGQYLSSRADVMPKPFLIELAKCQDSLPPPAFEVTQALIEKELGKPLKSIFKTVSREPIAVASIAAVYRAVLLDGTEVVIKVQHPQVRMRLLQDLKCLETIGETVRYLDADFDFSPVIREWAREVPKELDFINEALNMHRVSTNLAPYYRQGDDLSINVQLATVVRELVTEKVLVMTFVDGFKVDSKMHLEKYGVDKADLMNQITRAYAHQIFVDGFYSCDCHLGNLLVRRNDITPILLDFGLTKEIDTRTRVNFARMIVAADEMDIHGLLEALEGVGLKLRTDVPFDIALLAKYFFRDAKPSDAAKEENAQRRSQWKKEAEEKQRHLYIGDKVDASSKNLIGWRTVRKGEIVAVNQGSVDVRLTDGSIESYKRGDCKLQKSRSPIDSWPDSFIFFERVLGLLRGLTASLDVHNSYLGTMTPYARLSLAKETPRTESVHAKGHDELDMGPCLDSAIAQGDILGAQITVLRSGRSVVDLVAGVQDPYERVPVTPESLFCVFSVTKAITATAIHMLAEQGIIDLLLPVATYWPEFGAQGKENLTIQDVLNHRAGLQNAGTDEVARDPFLVCNSRYMADLMAAARPDPLTLNKTAYHYLSFGWITEGIVMATTGLTLQQYVQENIASKLGLNELMVGLPESAAKNPNVASLVLKKFDVTSQPERHADPPADEAQQRKRPTGTPSLLLNPTFFNNPRIRQASLSSANGFVSARALASFYSSLAADGALFKSPGGLVAMLDEPTMTSETTSSEKLLQGENGKFRLGFQIFEDSPQAFCFGHSGLGGSMGCLRYDKASGECVAIAMTFNRLTMDAKLTRSLMRQAFRSMGLPVPQAFSQE